MSGSNLSLGKKEKKKFFWIIIYNRLMVRTSVSLGKTQKEKFA
jgi:hypothetical protein